MKQKSFFSENGYEIVKLIVTHLCLSIFGIMVSIPFDAENVSGRFFCLGLGICAVLLYAYLIYTQIWEIGARDGINVRAGSRKNTPLRGLAIALTASILDFLLGGAYTILYYYQAYSPALSNASIVVGLVTSLWEGVYLGIWRAAFHSYPIYFVFAPLFPILVAEGAYLLGLRDFKLFRKAPHKGT